MSEAFQGGLHGILHLPCRLVHHVALRSLKSLSRPGHAFLGKLWKRRFSKRPGDSFRFCLATFRGRMQNQIGLTLNPFDHRRFLRLKGGGGLGDTLLSESRKGEISKALLNLVDLRLQSLEAGTGFWPAQQAPLAEPGFPLWLWLFPAGRWLRLQTHESFRRTAEAASEILRELSE